ncbi:GrpB family protein [Oceanirhabdus sp. W0125-5]|uniref:GrpB family protein n=1 Tax=Oceanirhabdus sp. W0125-5 TaxID=2999116 RepID=UPI0022F2E871|nr:GrpB family protein [Oceanirhabdus sp. W0125-5]WBW96973.1 GrpB family protein [Oceanirhabdus sp. W0125-5]
MNEGRLVRIMEVVPYNSKWKDDYINECEKIQSIMGEEILNIHHIGSTAISGIYAKPVIDILIEVKNIINIDKYNEGMIKLGYIPKGEHGIKNRRFFLKGEYNRTHHVHIFETENPEIKRHLDFRDYMIAHPEDAKCYEELKKELSIKFRYDNNGYCEGKNAFINKIDKKAKEWSETR